MKTQLIIHPNELSRRWIDYAVNLGVDVVGIHPVGGEKACESLAAMLRWLETDDAVNLIDYACSAGVGIEYELHAGSYLLPRELFSSHPEYFRCLDGRRTPDLNFAFRATKRRKSSRHARANSQRNCTARRTITISGWTTQRKAHASAKNAAPCRLRIRILK